MKDYIKFMKKEESIYNVIAPSKVQRALLVILVKGLDENYMVLEDPITSKYRIPVMAKLGQNGLGPNVVTSNGNVFLVNFNSETSKLIVRQVQKPEILEINKFNIIIPSDAQTLRLFIGRANDSSPIDSVLERDNDKWKISAFIHRWKF